MIRRIGDSAVAVMVILIIIMIIIPVPLGIIDFAISLNIAIALLILVISMFNKEALDFSVFPSLLLVTTLFRLALNISATRNILIHAHGGDVIEAFGNFVIGGDAIVGFIIFLIIIIVQFIVITKGSERVSEVAARFTLDAMPGKQMAIDADLNSGLISEDDAKTRRVKIQREADFYGAMDGATKFVKGDAIAAIIITVINIIAGIALGSSRGMEITEALSRYTLLTVGEGLVSQLPALMISTATGIVVTRSASDDSLGHDVIVQLINNERIMYIVAGVMFFLGLTPLPNLPFFGLAALFAYLGYFTKMQKEEMAKVPEGDMGQEEASTDDIRKPENIVPLLQVDPIELEFGYGIIPLADPNQGGDLFDRLVMIRRQIAIEYGIIVPMIRLRDNIQLSSNEYLIKIKGVNIASGNIMFDHYLAMNPGNADGEIEGIDTVEPSFGLPAKWIQTSEREKAEAFGYTVVDPSSVISTHLTEIIKKHAYELLGRKEVQSLINNVKENNPTLVDELIPNIMSIGDVQKVLSNLLREGVSVRDLVTILETLADYGYSTKDVNVLTEYVRQGLKRSLSALYFPTKRARVITVEPEFESVLMESIGQNENGSYLSIDPHVSQSFLNNLAVELQSLINLGEQPILVTVPIVRFYLKRLIESYIPELVVLSYNEIDSDVDIQSSGVVSG